MSLKGLIDGNPIPFSLDNSLTINNNVDVDGDLKVSGFIYDGGIPVGITGDNNVWTGTNDFASQTDQQAVPTNAEDIINVDYMQTKSNVGNAYLATDNTWTGTNTMTDLPVLGVASTLVDDELVSKLQVDNASSSYNTDLLTGDNTWTGTDAFSNTLSVPTPVVDQDFARKDYTDTALSTFNAGGGNVGFSDADGTTGGLDVLATGMINYTGIQFNLVGKGGNVSSAPLVGDTQIYYGGSGGYWSALFPPLDVDYEIRWVASPSAGTSQLIWTTSGASGDGAQIATAYGISAVGGGNADPALAPNVGGTGGNVGVSSGFGTGIIGQPGSLGQVVYGQGGVIADPAPGSAPAQINTFGVLNGYGKGGANNVAQLGTDAGTTNYASALTFKN